VVERAREGERGGRERESGGEIERGRKQRVKEERE
jgi:hypothetical protein